MTDRKKTPLELSSDARAELFFREDEVGALAGSRLASAEADPSADRSQAITELVGREPVRFLELVSYLPHVLQDMFLQYYLLGRTQTQIGDLLGISQTAIWQALRLGTEAICAVIYFGQPPTGQVLDLLPELTKKEKRLMGAWDAAAGYRVREGSREELVVRAPRALGAFEVGLMEDDLEAFFAPQTTDGPVNQSC